MEDLYCKVLVDSTHPRDALAEAIAAALDGAANGSTVITPVLEADIRQNEDWDPSRYAPDWDNFVFSRYYLDVEPRAGVERSTYVAAVARLLESLWSLKADAVAACDFEEELAWRGGLLRPDQRGSGNLP